MPHPEYVKQNVPASTTGLQSVTQIINVLNSGALNTAPQFVSQPAPQPVPSQPQQSQPNRWWMSASMAAQTQPAKAQTQPSAVPTQTSPPASQLPVMGQIRVNAVDGAEMVWIPKGEFIMGCNRTDINEKPERKVHLSGFWMYKHAVTVDQYKLFCAATGCMMPHQPSWGWQSKHPIVNVSWDDAVAYCKWAGVTLPTEAQWEKAARGADGNVYPWGMVWHDKKCCGSTMAAGRGNSPVFVGDCASGASPYGVLNMVGNVWEWCADWFDVKYYSYAPNINPLGPQSGVLRVQRGGSWKDGKTELYAMRRSYSHSTRLPTFGFRCTLN